MHVFLVQKTGGVVKYILIPGFGSCNQVFDGLKHLPDMDIELLEIGDHSSRSIFMQLEACAERYDMFALAGWSLGSLYALQWTLANPGTVSSLFLTGATARFTSRTGYDNGIDPSVPAKMLRLVKRRPQLVMDDFYNSLLKSTIEAERYHWILMENMPDGDYLATGLEALIVIDLLDSLKNISKPVYIFHGNSDTITPPTGAEILADGISGSVLEFFEGGHSPWTECPHECISRWKEFACSVNE
jgi:pimeloyl-ACP methyl ester carboxylesterase